MKQFIEGTEGVFHGLADEDYRKAPGINNSLLKHIAPHGEEPGSPAHFKVALSEPQPDTDALFFGRMVHSRILTPDAPLPEVVAIPETYPAEDGTNKPWHGGAKYCKQWLADQTKRGVRPIAKAKFDEMDGVVSAVAKHPVAAMALRAGKAEVSLFKRLHIREGRAVLCKARLD